MAKMKKRLTQSEEFEILKLVLDKFLWLGIGIVAYGIYLLGVSQEALLKGVSFMFGGVIILLLFMFLLIKEYEIVK